MHSLKVSPGLTILAKSALIVGTVVSMLIYLESCDEELPPPTISSLDPASGMAHDAVTINGSNFSSEPADNEVRFNGILTLVAFGTSSQLTVPVPEGATTGKVTVSTNGFVATSEQDFIVYQAPAITSFSPTGGLVGTTVTIEGSNFNPDPAKNEIKFNGTHATVSAATATHLTVIVPQGATTGKITVSTNNTLFASANDFTVFQQPEITSFAPTAGIIGVSVVITGSNFATTTSGNIVKFDGAAATVTAATATHITATVPADASTGKISVTANTLTGTSAGDFEFIPPPTISSFSPGSEVAGAAVTITGTNFNTNPASNEVRFNNTVAVITSATSTQLTATIPQGATTGNLTVATNGYIVSSAAPFTVLQQLSVTSFTPVSGAPGTTVVITGTRFELATAVKFSGVVAIVNSSTPTQINVTVPPGASTGKISVESDILGVTATSSDDFTIGTGAVLIVSNFAGSGTTGNNNGTGSAASFSNMTNLAVDSAGNVYVADELNQLVRKITPAGVVTTLAGSGTEASVDGTGTSASFNNPVALAVDGAGNVYVCDLFSHLIRKITPAGVVTTIAGVNGVAGSNDGSASQATFNNPHGIAVDLNGIIYIAENSANRIRKLHNGVVSTFAGSGDIGNGDGTGINSTFHSPWGLCVDKFGNVFVADTFNNEIRKITPAGVVTTVAGSGAQGGIDGTGAAAAFAHPTGISVDHKGNLYVSDFLNSTIRKVTPGGVVTTIAGATNNIGSDDGPGPDARFSNPYGVCNNAAGNIFYISDQGNRRIRKMVD